MKSKQCELEDKLCDNCGECDRCDLNPGKRCDNCEQCLQLPPEGYYKINIDAVILEDAEE